MGDFVLTLPFLRVLAQTSPDLLLVTRRACFQAFGDVLPGVTFLDVDGAAGSRGLAELEDGRPAALWQDRVIYSFLPDPTGELAAGASRAGARAYVPLVSRPAAPPHVARRMFTAAGLTPPPDLLRAAVLDRGPRPTATACWLHPGSGSPAKNAPPAVFRAAAEAALAAGCDRLVLSFGEADTALREPLEAAVAGLPADVVADLSLPELRRALAERAARYVGNDSGVTHLAAALGIPVEVHFLVTDPRIWRPIGPAVRVVGHGNA